MARRRGPQAVSDVSVCEPGELSGSDIQAWRNLQATDPGLGSPNLSPCFTAAVGRAKSNARVAVVREGSEPVAFLPFHQTRFGIGLAIGIGVSDAQAVICAPDFELDPVDLCRRCGLAVWEYDNLVCRQVEFSPHSWWTRMASVMDVQEGFEAYVSSRQHSHLHKIVRKRRLLEREIGALDFRFDAEDPGALETLMRWKSAQYQRTGIFDRFSRPWFRDLVRDLAGCDDPGCRGVLSTLSAGGMLMAVHFGLVSNSRFSLWLPAYDRALRKYAPGLQLYLSMAQAAPQQGIGLLDLGTGDEPYKEFLTSWQYPAAMGRVRARVVPGLIRRFQNGSVRRRDRFVACHPQLRSHLPRSLAQVDRIQ